MCYNDLRSIESADASPALSTILPDFFPNLLTQNPPIIFILYQCRINYLPAGKMVEPWWLHFFSSICLLKARRAENFIFTRFKNRHHPLPPSPLPLFLCDWWLWLLLSLFFLFLTYWFIPKLTLSCFSLYWTLPCFFKLNLVPFFFLSHFLF